MDEIKNVQVRSQVSQAMIAILNDGNGNSTETQEPGAESAGTSHPNKPSLNASNGHIEVNVVSEQLDLKVEPTKIIDDAESPKDAPVPATDETTTAEEADSNKPAETIDAAVLKSVRLLFAGKSSMEVREDLSRSNSSLCLWLNSLPDPVPLKSSQTLHHRLGIVGYRQPDHVRHFATLTDEIWHKFFETASSMRQAQTIFIRACPTCVDTSFENQLRVIDSWRWLLLESISQLDVSDETNRKATKATVQILMYRLAKRFKDLKKSAEQVNQKCRIAKSILNDIKSRLKDRWYYDPQQMNNYSKPKSKSKFRDTQEPKPRIVSQRLNPSLKGDDKSIHLTPNGLLLRSSSGNETMFCALTNEDRMVTIRELCDVLESLIQNANLMIQRALVGVSFNLLPVPDPQSQSLVAINLRSIMTILKDERKMFLHNLKPLIISYIKEMKTTLNETCALAKGGAYFFKREYKFLGEVHDHLKPAFCGKYLKKEKANAVTTHQNIFLRISVNRDEPFIQSENKTTHDVSVATEQNESHKSAVINVENIQSKKSDKKAAPIYSTSCSS